MYVDVQIFQLCVEVNRASQTPASQWWGMMEWQANQHIWSPRDRTGAGLGSRRFWASSDPPPEHPNWEVLGGERSLSHPAHSLTAGQAAGGWDRAISARFSPASPLQTHNHTIISNTTNLSTRRACVVRRVYRDPFSDWLFFFLTPCNYSKHRQVICLLFAAEVVLSLPHPSSLNKRGNSYSREQSD